MLETCGLLAACKAYRMCFINCLRHIQHREPQEQDKVRPREHTLDKDPIPDFLYQCGEQTRKYTLNANQYRYHVMHFTKHFPFFNLHIILQDNRTVLISQEWEQRLDARHSTLSYEHGDKAS